MDQIIKDIHIFNGIQYAQDQIYLIEGPLHEHINEKASCLDHSDLRSKITKAGEILYITHLNNKKSLILSGLCNNKIIIDHKINHILIRKSQQLTIETLGTISGIDILNCRNVIINVVKHNFTSIEYSDQIDLYGEIDEISQIRISNCLDINVNNKQLMINPFNNLMFGKNNIS